MMLLWENLKLAITAIRINKMRSFLTMLGMIIGISSVIAIVSIGDTMRSLMADQYKSVGVNRVMAYMSYSEDFRMSDYFTEDDLDKVKNAFPEDITYIDFNVADQTTLTMGKKTEKIIYQGVRGGYTDVQPMDIVYGRMINQKDMEQKKMHTVIEDKTAIRLFGQANAVGKKIRVTLKGTMEELTVVGIYHTPESILNVLMGNNNYDTIYVPESIIVYPDNTYFALNFYTAEETNQPLFQKQFKGLVSRMKNRTESQVEYVSARDQMQSMDGILAGMSAAVGAIAAISLLVGGIGIMNIMLVSVTERTREIGIRKALGARTGDVLFQFLIESALISAAGGIIGVSLGVGLVMFGGSKLGVAVVVNPQIIVVAVAFSAVVGVFFGLYPAFKAAKADPIVALRYE